MPFHSHCDFHRYQCKRVINCQALEMDRSNSDNKRRNISDTAERLYKRRLTQVEFDNYVAGLASGPSTVHPPLNETPEGLEESLHPINLTDDVNDVGERCAETNEEDLPAADPDTGDEDDVCFDGEPAFENNMVNDGDHPFGDATFEEGLRLWSLKTGQTHSAINLLLCHIRQHIPAYKLPRTASTFLRTPSAASRRSEMMAVPGGKQWYKGIEKCLHSCFRNVLPAVDGFDLDIFLDGLPLFKSSKKGFWPILAKVRNVPKSPVMTVGIFFGKSKPSSLDTFLRPLVTELNSLAKNGIKFGSRSFYVGVRAIIADAPARAFAKGVRSHSAYHGCMKCTIVAERKGKRMFYRYGAPCDRRTDELFRAGAYPRHIKEETPLTDLDGLDIIEDIIVSEEMHLIDKGVVAKLLKLWIIGFKRLRNRLTPRQQRKVSAHMRKLKIPTDFRRRLRDLDEIAHWKAAEYKVFLLLVGPAVLKGRLPDAAYKHFMCLCVAITLLSSTQHEDKWEYANQLLHRFVADYGELYDPSLVNSNVHNLLHIFDDCCRFGDLRSMSAYPFEAKLHDLKKQVRTGRNALEQAVNRMEELEKAEAATSYSIAPTVESVRTVRGDTIAVLRRGFWLRKNFGDQWFLTNNGTVVRYETAIKTGANVVIQGCTFVKQDSAFLDPCDSVVLDIHSAKMCDLAAETLHTYTSDDILCKVAAIQTVEEDLLMFIPLPHTYVN